MGDEELEKRHEPDFLVVGIGASASALSALRELLSNVSRDELAMVVVMHDGAGHEPEIVETLKDATKLPVVVAGDGTRVVPGNIYLAPPAHDAAVFHGAIHLMPPVVHPRTPRLPVDYLLKSLAADRGPAAIGVVLAGTGTDGIYGLRAIRAEGGITFAQRVEAGELDAASAQLHVPVADARLPPHQIGDELNKLGEGPYLPELRARVVAAADHNDVLGKIFVLIRAAHGTDLSLYKHTTIDRRIERRMAVLRIETPMEYVRYLQGHPEELETLYHDCLIGVTAFFRDHEPFEVLKSLVFPRLFERKGSLPARVWVPGCATGEEAYSIAICMLEYLDGIHAHEAKVQIFASDLDERAISYARRGQYPANIAQDVSPARLERFFTVGEGEQYEISRTIRDMIIFAKQDMTKDPPFSHVDLVSCRNVLIYFQPALQRRALRIFHYALNPDGVLLLGSAETIGDSADQFAMVDKQQKIYAKKNVPAAAVFDLNVDAAGVAIPNPPPHVPTEPRPAVSVYQVADRKILELYGPPGVLVDQHYDVLQFRGHVGPYLDPPPGAAKLNLLKLIQPELVLALRPALQRALADEEPVTVQDVRVRSALDERRVDIQVLPLHEPDTRNRCLLVLFEQASETLVATPNHTSGSNAEPRVRDLERELAATKEYLQSTIEELESANEELKSANEELQSSNEELQSTNEELETSKEELQSTNEELNTVNDELQGRMIELTQANDDVQNISTATREAIVVVGIDLRIRRFTHGAEMLLNLVPTDVGRPIAYLNSYLGQADLSSFVLDCINRISERVEEVTAGNGRRHRLRVLPYKTSDHAIRGALLVVTEMDGARRPVPGNIRPFAADAVAAAPVPLVIVDQQLRVTAANSAFHEAFQDSGGGIIGKPIAELASGIWKDEALKDRLTRLLREGIAFRGLELHDGGGGDHDGRRYRLSGARLPGESFDQAVLVIENSGS
jgi:two-component system, chemotaxis family, CheB/CheR fusion protein